MGNRGFAVLAAAAAAAVAGGADPLPAGVDPYEIEALAVGDFDGDGTPDVAVGMPLLTVGKLKEAGEIRAYSGKNGALILRFPGTGAEEERGRSLAAIGDVNKDGATDLASGFVNEMPSSFDRTLTMPQGRVEFLSGRNGSLLRRIDAGKEYGSMHDFGSGLCALGDGSGRNSPHLVIQDASEDRWTIAEPVNWDRSPTVKDAGGLLVETRRVGDLDGDGAEDFALCDFSADAGKVKGVGRIRVLSGGAVRAGAAKPDLLTLTGKEAYEALGLVAGPAGDWNGDGKGDLLVGRSGSDEGKKRPWSVQVLAGTDGAVLWTATGEGKSVSMGGAVALADLDEDGKPEIAVGTPGLSGKAGAVALLSSKDGKPVWTVAGAGGERLGEELHAFPDLDKDGFPDLLVLAPGAKLEGKTGKGRVRVLSGKTGATLVAINPLVAK